MQQCVVTPRAMELRTEPTLATASVRLPHMVGAPKPPLNLNLIQPSHEPNPNGSIMHPRKLSD